MSAVVQDLPVPVVPRMAKCLPSRSSTRIMAEMEGSWRMQPTRTELRLSPQKACSSSGARGNADTVAKRGIDGNAAIETWPGRHRA